MSKCRCRQHWRYTYINKLLLLPLGHTGQAVVLSREVSFQPRERGDHNVLHLSPLCPAAGRRKAEAPDAAPRPHPWWEDVALIKLTMGDLKEEVVYWFTHIPPSCSPPLKKKKPKSHCTKRGASFCPGMTTSPWDHKYSRYQEPLRVSDTRGFF